MNRWFFAMLLAGTCSGQKLIEFEPARLADADVTQSKGWAVVVGIDSYTSDRFSNLRLAVRDARAVGQMLAEQGWQVSYLLSDSTDAKLRPTKASQVLDKVEAMARLAGPRDRLLFYFSGHGFSVDRVNYLCVGETEFEGHVASALSERDVLRAMEGSRTRRDEATGGSREETYSVRARKKLIVLDACRSDGKGGRRGGFTEKELAEARGVGHLYATAPGFESYEPLPGQQLDGAELGHSFFTHFFLKGLQGAAESNGDGFVTFLEVVDYASYELAQRTFRGELREQKPYYVWDGPWGDVLLTRVERSAFVGRHTEVRKFALGAELVYLEGGTFLMGSPDAEAARDADEVLHRVTLTHGFWMWRTELTQGQWKEVMGTEPWREAYSWMNATVDPEHPAVTVSWDDAVSFCKKLTERERSAGRMPEGFEYRLPTEAEWEYACRAGTRTPFSFGGTISPSQVNYDGNHPYGGGSQGEFRRQTVRVGSLPANGWGLHEMHGNVWEWCLDHADYIDGKVVADTYRDGITDPKCQRGSLRVIRGGMWSIDAKYCRSAERLPDEPGSLYITLGFRPVLARIP